jgi:uncharacterized membrane protein YdjX (TVP38/TMEM64 family)
MLRSVLEWKTFLSGSFASYAKTGGLEHGAKFRIVDLFFILVYSAACSIAPVPTLAEAPMFLFPRLSRATVLLTCAMGKALGALVLFVLGGWITRFHFVGGITRLLFLEGLFSRVSNFVEAFMQAYGFWAFLVSMSVPFFPMRTAIYFASVLGVNVFKFAFAVAVGTIIRNSIVFWGYAGIRKFRLRIGKIGVE